MITATIELIAEKGFANTTTADIGERAGYSRSMIQFRYGTKEALLESVLRAEYETRLLDAEPATGTGLEQLLNQVDRLRDEAITNPDLMRGFYALCFESIGPVPSLRTWISDWLGRYEATTANAIKTGIADGSIRPDIDPHHEAEAFIASGLGYAFRWMATAEAIDYPALLQQWQSQLHEHLTRKSPETALQQPK
ncbi:MAG TPA: TetR/AcrR family transcriptional regulator [Pseudonocardia sp.]